MNYKETGFRAIYKHFTAFALTDSIRSVVKDFPGIEEANCALTYGYIDHDAGLTLEILALGTKTESSFRFFDGNNTITVKLRIGSVEAEPFFWFEDEDGSLHARYKEKIDTLKHYEVNEEIEKTRTMGFLDSTRHPYFIDDVMVILVKDGLQPEGCWTRITDCGEHSFIGTLLNEPNQDFGCHEGDTITFFVRQTDDKEIVCFADLTPPKKLKAEDLEDGTMLKNAVQAFYQEQTKENLLEILTILRDSFVWIPCNAILDEKDQALLESLVKGTPDDPEALIGTEFTNQEAIRLVPDILQNGDQYFFPIFSSAEEMGEYGDHFSKVQKHIFEAIALAKNNEKKPGGIVLNAFSEPFRLDFNLLEILENMESSLEE